MLTETLKVPRTVAAYREPISQFTLHAFGDDSTKGSCGAVYAVVQQAQGTTQQLISAKSRLAKENQSIPRLELIAGHMALNLATNMQAALQLIPSTVHCWLDSAVAFYLIKNAKTSLRSARDRDSQVKKVGWQD